MSQSIEDFFLDFEQKGRAAYDDMMRSVLDWTIQDINSRPTFGYTAAIPATASENIAPVQPEVAMRMEEDGMPKNGWVWRTVYANQQPPHEQPPHEYPYQWTMHPNGAICILYTDKSVDWNSPNLKQEYGEILWAHWQETALAAGNNNGDDEASVERLGALRTIWRWTISNEATEKIISYIRGKNRVDGEWTDFMPNDPEFFAFLASPHGKFLPKLLKTHTNALERKTVVGVRLHLHPQYAANLCWLLAPAQMPEKPTSSSETPRPKTKLSAGKLRRKAKKSD